MARLSGHQWIITWIITVTELIYGVIYYRHSDRGTFGPNMNDYLGSICCSNIMFDDICLSNVRRYLRPFNFFVSQPSLRQPSLRQPSLRFANLRFASPTFASPTFASPTFASPTFASPTFTSLFEQSLVAGYHKLHIAAIFHFTIALFVTA